MLPVPLHMLVSFQARLFVFFIEGGFEMSLDISFLN